ncbi:hypothetical protein GCM10027184_75200 [Saccharothrix stipae]
MPAQGDATAGEPQTFGSVSYTGFDDKGAPRQVTTTAEGDLDAAARQKARELGHTSALDSVAAAAATPPRRPPAEPEGTEFQECLDSDGANSVTGRVHNRFLWCQRWTLEAKRFTTGPTGTRVVASMTMKYSAVAYGRDDGNRGVTVFFRGDDADFWPTPKGYIRPESTLYQRVACQGENVCHDDAAHTGKQIKDWVGRWTRFDVTSDGSGSSRDDKVTRHQWLFNGYVIDSWNMRLLDGDSDRHTIRCDSAAYFGLKRRGACVFDDVTPHLQYSLDEEAVDEVAEHIRCAQDEPFCLRDGQPHKTYPRTEGPKFIPGKFIAGDRDDFRALHRINASRANPDARYTANRNTVRSTCAKLPTDVYDTSKGQECDEYPFASTAEGAACCQPPLQDWDFSVEGVLKADNGCAGNALKKYYRDDRVLYQQDGFFVRITNAPPSGPAVCEAIPPDEDEPDGDGGTPPVNLPPTANAGPDVSGLEGRPVVLNGSASDPEGATLALGWSATPGPGVDPGATCSFGTTTSAATNVSCTDDGTFTVTLTARDGANGPVSDSAIVTLSNVRPGLGGLRPEVVPSADTPPDVPGIHAPTPWQVFRVGTPVNLVAAYTEPGANDTHTCVTDWDDGTTSTYKGEDLTCAAGHAFAHPGMYTIRTSVTDDDSGSDTAEVMVVVYDPDAGFATGGGHYSDPGRTHFQFNPKYLPHDEGPVPGNGKVTVGDVRSASLEWLVVTPDDKIAVKGVMEGGTHGFVLYAYDDPDSLRLVLWPLAAGPHPTTVITRDTVKGASFDLDAARPRPIDNGSVQAHN